jgi:uncharacterized protein YndB with AHSA1/START domain
MSTTRNSKTIHASAEKVYQAFTDPKALEQWLVPGKMTGKIHQFDLRVGGGYEMSLFYPDSDSESRGKTSGKEDRYSAKFIELDAPRKIIQAITFESDNPDFSGEMIEEAVLVPEGKSTRVTIIFKNIPTGIKPEDNEAGTNSSLKKLARYVEQH